MNKEIEKIREKKQEQVKSEQLIIKDNARVQDTRRVVPSSKG